MSKLDQINTFIQVVGANGFANAAKRLNISTAAVSRQVTALEADLGTQLLTRTTRRLTLTETGMQYYQSCKKILGELKETELTIAGSQQEAQGILRILCNRYFAQDLIIPQLPLFLAQHPKLKIQLEIAERFPNLIDENIDIVFGVSLPGSETLVRKKIGETSYVLCAAPAYLKKFPLPKTIASLTEHHYLAHIERRPVDVIVFADGKEVFIEPYIVLNDTFAMRECALQGLGIAKLHHYMIANELENQKLIAILPEHPFETIPVYLYYQPSHYLLPKIRRFIDFFVKN